MSRFDNLPRVYEPDEHTTHYASADGTDMVTLCGHTDWIGQSTGIDTQRPVDCNACQAYAAHFSRYLKVPK